MAQRSARRGRENQGKPECFEHALGVMDPARELPYRPAADHRRIRGRTDGSIRLRAATILQFSLAWEGTSTDGLGGGFAVFRRLNGLKRAILSWMRRRAVHALKLPAAARARMRSHR